jgi:signal transduction histidine kinase
VLRRSLVIIPLLAAGAALLGVALAPSPLLAVGAAAAVALAVTILVEATAERRVRGVVDRVTRLAEGETASRGEVGGSQQWQRLETALNAVGGSLQHRFDELASERARVERLLDNLPLATLLFSEERLAYANPAARRQFDLGADDAGSLAEILTAKALADAVHEAGVTGGLVEVETEHESRHLLARASATAPGEVALVVTDVTELRRVEAMRRDFVVNASHELKTPAAGIQALADSIAIAVDRDPARARLLIDRLQGEAQRLARMVRDLLDLARLEETGTTRRQRVDVARVVRDEIDRYRELAEERGVTVDTATLRSGVVVARPEDLRLIVGNLLENALRYNRDGGGVQIGTTTEDATVVLEVSDTGIGIPEADRDRVFERFYRVDKARSRAAGGTGLGLSLVRNAVLRSGGSVRLDSILGEGTRLRVELPVDATEDGV